MGSTLHTNTTQYPKSPTDLDYEHTPIIRKVSNHEVMVDISHFHHPQTKDHCIKNITLYSLKRIVDEIHFHEGENVYKVIFDIDKINEKDRKMCEMNDDRDWVPRNWDMKSTYHAVITCNIHGNWSDVSEDYL